MVRCVGPCFDWNRCTAPATLACWGKYEWGGNPHEASEALPRIRRRHLLIVHYANLIVQGEADDRCPSAGEADVRGVEA